MGSQILANPDGAFRTVTDYRTGRDSAGLEIKLPQTVEFYTAATAVTKGAPVAFVAPTQTVPLQVTLHTTAITAADGGPARFAGAALETVAAGEQLAVCTDGFCEVLIDSSDTAALYAWLHLPATTNGRFDVSAAGAPADNALYCGVVYSIEIPTDTDRCLARIGQPLTRFEAGA